MAWGHGMPGIGRLVRATASAGTGPRGTPPRRTGGELTGRVWSCRPTRAPDWGGRAGDGAERRRSTVARWALETAGNGRGEGRIVAGRAAPDPIRDVARGVADGDRPLRRRGRFGRVDRGRREDRGPPAGGTVAGAIERHGAGRRSGETRPQELRPVVERRRGEPVSRFRAIVQGGMPLEPVAAGRLGHSATRQRAGRRHRQQDRWRAGGAAGATVDHDGGSGRRGRKDQGSWTLSPPARVPRARHTTMSMSDEMFCTLPSIIVTPTPAGW